MTDSSSIIWLEETESTNTDAAKHISTIDNMSVIAAEHQTAGRGQGDHTWTSARSENMTFSLVLKYPPMLPVKSSEILLITQFITHAIVNYLQSHGIESRIKWPNDIYVGDKKICGILITNTMGNGCLLDSIIGVGLNLNQLTFPAEIPNPTSLSLLTGLKYNLRSEVSNLYESIKKSAELLNSVQGRTILDKFFNARVFRLDEERR